MAEIQDLQPEQRNFEVGSNKFILRKQGEVVMSWHSYIRGSTPIACYRDPNLNGKKVKVCGYSPSLNDLGPPHLFIPEGHTGTLTGLVELTSFAQDLPSDIHVPVECMILTEVHWNDIDRWHDGFCHHGRKTYRESCLIDYMMSGYRMPPMFLFFVDTMPDNMQCVEQQIREHITITSIPQNSLNPTSPRMTWIE